MNTVEIELDEKMDHKSFINSLPSHTRRKLNQRSNKPGLIRLFFHWGLIIAFGVAIHLSVPGWPLLLIPQGILIVFVFTVLHEAIHQSAFKSGWLNHAAARVCGFLIFLPCTWFKYFHFAHHRFTQIPGEDPELDYEKPNNTLSYVSYFSGIPTWLGHFKTLLENSVGQASPKLVPKNAEICIVTEARLLILIYTLILGGAIFNGSMSLFWCWILPLLLGQPFLRGYLLAEHGLCPQVVNMLDNTRTTSTNTFVRFVSWNMSYHTEHHTLPSVPFHKLPDLHELMQQELIHTEPSYTAFIGKYHTRSTENSAV